MAKKIDKVYLNKNSELDTQNILIEGKEKTDTAKKVGKTTWNILRPVAIFAIAFVVVFCCAKFAYDKVKTSFFEPVSTNDSVYKTIEIPKGASLSEISEILADNEIIRNKNVFKLYVDFSDMSSKLKAGKYNLSPAMSFDDIVYELRQGVLEAPTARITFPEGKTVAEYADILIKNGVTIDKDKFLKECLSGNKFSDISYVNNVLENVEESGNLRKFNLEGYLFPDTYEFYKDAKEEDIINRLLNRFDEIVTEEYIARASEMGMSIDEAIILASIIEKEGVSEDFPKISAVFHNRLKLGMPLQSDATLQYELNKGSVILSQEELESQTGYSTHERQGLPVGPVSNPGNAAIKAALYPDEEYIKDKYLFFCLTTPDTGLSVFAKTNEEHEANKRQWEPLWE